MPQAKTKQKPYVHCGPCSTGKEHHACDRPWVAFAAECAKWLKEGKAPLSPNALYTGEGPEDQTFGDKAKELWS